MTDRCKGLWPHWRKPPLTSPEKPTLLNVIRVPRASITVFPFVIHCSAFWLVIWAPHPILLGVVNVCVPRTVFDCPKKAKGSQVYTQVFGGALMLVPTAVCAGPDDLLGFL
jgi:hypothetical protein